MKCPKCNTEIPDQFKFCPECGSSVSAISGQSGVEGDVSIGNLKTMVGGAASPTSASDLSMGDMRTIAGGGDPGATGGDNGFVSEPLSHRYELHEEIGRGGFAVVYRATDKKLGRIVAIKKLLKNHDEVEHQTLERFKREARVIAGLNHRNVVGVYDVGEDYDGIYLVMEYVEGGTLRDLLKDKGKLELPEALNLMRGMVQGLSYAHRKNLVHRDIKPANILLQRDGDELIPKIVDFGLAQAGRDSELSMSGYGMGTPWYMPPEQRRDAKNVNHTADIYAVGKTLYEMISGEIPDNVDQDMIPPPPALKKIIAKCIKSKPEERYFSADELLQALEGIAGTNHPKIGNRQSEIGNANSCPACGAENPKDMKFCEGCGGGLFRNCPECGRENSIHKQFCGGCGADVEGFANAQEILQRMEGYAKEKKWSRVVKEYGLFNQDMRLLGKKGAELRVQLEKGHKASMEKLQEREQLKKQIGNVLKKDDKLEHALELVCCYQEIDLNNKEINELPAEIRKRIDQRDYRQAISSVRSSKKKPDFLAAIDVCNGYLKSHPEGQHAQAVKGMVEMELPEQIGNLEYASAQTVILAHKGAAGKQENLELKAQEYGALIKRCEAFVLEYPNHKNTPIIQHELDDARAKLAGFRGEITYQALLPYVERELRRHNYYAVEEIYRTYLGKHKTREPEVRKMLEETLPELKVARAAELRRLKRKRRVQIGMVGAVVAAAIFIVFVIDRVVLSKNIRVFKVAIEQKDSSRVRVAANKISPRYNIASELMAFEDFDAARANYRDAVGNDADLLEKFGGMEWSQMAQRVEKAESPGDPAEGTRLFKEALASVVRIRAQVSGLLRAEAAFSKVWKTEDARLKKHVSVEYKTLSVELEKTKEITDPKEGERAYKELFKELLKAVKLTDQRKRQADYESALSDAKKAEELMDWNAASAAYDRALNSGVVNLREAKELKGKLDLKLKPARDAKAAYEKALVNADRELLGKQGGTEWDAIQHMAEKGAKTKEPQQSAQYYDLAASQLNGLGYSLYVRAAVEAGRTGDGDGVRKWVPKALAIKQTAEMISLLERYPSPQEKKVWTAKLGSGVTLDFMPITAGSFQMGSNNGDSDEKPVHRVTLSKPFWLAKTEVTQEQYQKIMGTNPSSFKGSQNPVEKVSWNDAVSFCKKLTAREQQAGRLPAGFEYTLPTEAQWEYACRAGTTGDYAGNLDEMAWYDSNSGNMTHPVGTKQANAWGLHDMHGNVWEWCSDWHGDYPSGSVTDPPGASSGSRRVRRGGSWSNSASRCRSAYRNDNDPSFTNYYLGFRPLVLER